MINAKKLVATIIVIVCSHFAGLSKVDVYANEELLLADSNAGLNQTVGEAEKNSMQQPAKYDKKTYEHCLMAREWSAVKLTSEEKQVVKETLADFDGDVANVLNYLNLEKNTPEHLDKAVEFYGAYLQQRFKKKFEAISIVKIFNFFSYDYEVKLAEQKYGLPVVKCDELYNKSSVDSSISNAFKALLNSVDSNELSDARIIAMRAAYYGAKISSDNVIDKIFYLHFNLKYGNRYGFSVEQLSFLLEKYAKLRPNDDHNYDLLQKGLFWRWLAEKNGLNVSISTLRKRSKALLKGWNWCFKCLKRKIAKGKKNHFEQKLGSPIYIDSDEKEKKKKLAVLTFYSDACDGDSDLIGAHFYFCPQVLIEKLNLNENEMFDKVAIRLVDENGEFYDLWRAEIFDKEGKKQQPFLIQPNLEEDVFSVFFSCKNCAQNQVLKTRMERVSDGFKFENGKCYTVEFYRQNELIDSENECNKVYNDDNFMGSVKVKAQNFEKSGRNELDKLKHGKNYDEDYWLRWLNYVKKFRLECKKEEQKFRKDYEKFCEKWQKEDE